MKFRPLPRPLFAALFLSTAVHGVLLFGFERAEMVRPALTSGSMQVLLGLKPAPAASPMPTPAIPARHDTARSRQLAAPPESSERRVSAADSHPAAPVAGEVGAPSASSAAAGAVAERPPEGIDADGVRQYRIDLASAARRFRVYPAVARARGWEGTVELAIASGPLVSVPVIRVTRSSGHPVLDEQAVSMLSQAVRVAPLPDSLRGRELNISLPIRFSLED